MAQSLASGLADLGLAPITPFRLEYRNPRAKMIVAGIAFLAVPVPLLLVGITLLVSDILSGSLPPGLWLFFQVSLLIFVIVLLIVVTVGGAFLTFGRYGVLFDKEAGTMTLWCRSPLGRWQTVHLLESYQTIHVRNSGRNCHHVCFTGPPAAEVVVIAALLPRKQTEMIADQIGRFLGWEVSKEPLTDSRLPS